MRTLIIIAVGLIIASLLVSLLPKKFLMITGMIFSLGWLAATVLNLRIGLAHGYSLAEETPIHLVLYLVPVSVYWLLYFYLKR